MYSAFANADTFSETAWDQLLDPHSRRSFPVPPQSLDRPPPKIGYGEVTTNTKTRRQIGLANLRQNRDRGNRGNAGLAVVNRSGEVVYTVFDPTLNRVLWRGSIGRLTLQQRNTAQGREDGVRRLLARRTNQTFEPHPVHRSGPDLMPQSRQLSFPFAQPARSQVRPTAFRQSRSKPRDRLRFF